MWGGRWEWATWDRATWDHIPGCDRAPCVGTRAGFHSKTPEGLLRCRSCWSGASPGRLVVPLTH